MHHLSHTHRALLARGLTTQEAEILVSAGLGVERARGMSVDALIQIGLSEPSAINLRKGSRPPIQPDIVSKLIFEAAATCCVCKTPNQPFVFHHINEWGKGGGNEYENLVLLCLNDHNFVHTKGGLAQGISPQQLRELKRLWLAKVDLDTRTAISSSLASDDVHWDYINHRRLFEIMERAGLRVAELSGYSRLVSRGIIDENGALLSLDNWGPGAKSAGRLSYVYGSYEGLYMHGFYKDVIDRVIPRLGISDMTDRWTKRDFKRLLVGDYIVCQKAFYIRNDRRVEDGPGQIRRVYRREAGVKMEFCIDAFEATSISSLAVHLCGRKVLTPILRITSIREEAGNLQIAGSCLAVSGTARMHSSPDVRWMLEGKFRSDGEFDMIEL